MDHAQMLTLQSAIDELNRNPATAHYHELLEVAETEALGHDQPLTYLERQGGPAARLVRLQLGGYLDPAAHAERQVVAMTATDVRDDCRPSAERQAEMNRIPSIPDLLAMAESGQEPELPR